MYRSTQLLITLAAKHNHNSHIHVSYRGSLCVFQLPDSPRRDWALFWSAAKTCKSGEEQEMSTGLHVSVT